MRGHRSLQQPRPPLLFEPKAAAPPLKRRKLVGKTSPGEAAPKKLNERPAGEEEKARLERRLEAAAADERRLEEHILKHIGRTLEEPKYIIGRTHWKRMWMSILEKCSYTNPVTSKKETWLGFRNGHAICVVCNSYLREPQSGAQDDVSLRFHTLKRSYLATGRGFNLNILDGKVRERLSKHNTQSGHTGALEAYCYRLRARAEFVPTFAWAP